MAQLALKLADNVDGEFFVDSTCIDCDACRQIAPTVFHDIGDQSAVYRQPQTEEELLAAQKALISCPTASIGTASRHDMSRALADLPEHVDEDVYRCGYTSESSFGAFSYLIRKESGNVLIDSPRFAGPLVKNIERMGGVARMLLTRLRDRASVIMDVHAATDPFRILLASNYLPPFYTHTPDIDCERYGDGGW